MYRNYNVITFISKNLYFKKAWSSLAIVAEVIKIVTIFIKAIFKNSRKIKIIRNYVSNCNLYLYFLT